MQRLALLQHRIAPEAPVFFLLLRHANADIDSSVIIESVDINDYTFEIPEDKELQWSAEDENGVKHPTNADSPTQGYSKVTFVVNVYSVYNMDKPDVELKK